MFRGGKRALAQIAHNSILKFADEGERLRRAERQKLVEFAFTAREGGLARSNFRRVFCVLAQVIENGGFQTAKAEIERIAFHFDGAELDGRGDAARSRCGKAIKNWSARIAESEKFRNFVVGFAGGIIARLAELAVVKLSTGFGVSSLLRADFIKNGVASGYDQANGGKFRHEAGLVSFEKNGVDMTFEMIYRHKRLAESVRERFAVGNAHQKRANQAWALRYPDGTEIGEIQTGLGEGLADDRNDLPKVFARGEFRNHAAVFSVDVNLGSDDARKDFPAVSDNGSGSFVARRLNAEYANAHAFMLAQRC